MKLYELAFTPAIDPEVLQDQILVFRYFSSCSVARSWANLLIKKALARFKESHSIDRWADLEWEEKVAISEIHTAKVPAKELVLRMANFPITFPTIGSETATWMESRTTIEVWTPKTKWTTPELAAEAYPKGAYRISECSLIAKVDAELNRLSRELDDDGPTTLEEVGISLVSESEWEPGSVRIEYQGESYTLLADSQLADLNWDSGLTSLGGGAVGRLLERPDVSRAFEKALHRHSEQQEAT